MNVIFWRHHFVVSLLARDTGEDPKCNSMQKSESCLLNSKLVEFQDTIEKKIMLSIFCLSNFNSSIYSINGNKLC